MKQFLEKLSQHEELSGKEMQAAAEELLSDHIADSEIAAFLMALKSKGETAAEIAALAEVLRRHARPFPKVDGNVMDNCGTGGDRSHSFNISTVSAFVISGAGIKVAKHGSRSVSSKTGSADVLEALGISLSLESERMAEALEEIGISFLFAPAQQPRLAKITKIRRELKIPTVFNLIGPLTNPVQLTTQLIGIYRPDMLPIFAEAVRRLGRKRAVFVTGAGNMDEASLQGENQIVLLDGGKVSSFILRPEDAGLAVCTNETLQGGDALENAGIMKRVLKNEEGPHRDAVLLNAGLGIFANGAAATITEGVNQARKSLESGSALHKLESLIEYSQKQKAVM